METIHKPQASGHSYICLFQASGSSGGREQVSRTESESHTPHLMRVFPTSTTTLGLMMEPRLAPPAIAQPLSAPDPTIPALSPPTTSKPGAPTLVRVAVVPQRCRSAPLC